MNIGFKSNLVLNLVFKFMAIGYGFYVLRWLNLNIPENEFVDYNVITSYTASILTIISFGIPVLLHREFTNNHSKAKLAKFWSSFGLFRLASYFIGLMVIFVSYRLSKSTNLGLIIGIFTVQFILIVDLSYRSVCDALGRSWQFSLTDFIAKTVLYIGLVLAVVFEYTNNSNALSYFLYLSGLVYGLALLLDAFLQRKYITWGKPDFSIIKNNLSAITYTSISAITIGAYLLTDKIFLRQMGFEDEINGYSNAYKLYEVAQTVPGLSVPIIASQLKRKLDNNINTPIGTKLIRRFPTLNSYNPKMLIIVEWTVILSIVGVLSTLGFLLLGNFSIGIIDPFSLYPIAFKIIPILALTLIPLTLTMLFGGILNLLHGERYDLISSIWTMVVALLMYSVFISRYGAVGAAYATCLTYVFGTLLKGFYIKRVVDNYYTKSD